MKKKILTIAYSAMLGFCLAGCGEKEEEIVVNDRPRERAEADEITPTEEPLMQQEPETDPDPEPEPENVDYEEVYLS